MQIKQIRITNRAFVSTNDYSLGSELDLGAVSQWAELMPERAAELLAEYQSWLRRFAAAFRLPVLDFDRAFTRWGEEGLFQPDGLHPNAAGHCLMAETAAALIRSL